MKKVLVFITISSLLLCGCKSFKKEYGIPKNADKVKKETARYIYNQCIVNYSDLDGQYEATFTFVHLIKNPSSWLSNFWG